MRSFTQTKKQRLHTEAAGGRDGTTVQINNPFIFDLNGHSVDALSVDAKATIKDSGTTKGRIGKVTVSNEKVTDLTLGSLLEEGYAIQVRKRLLGE